jgi:NADH:ubiquinone oxidoreductase subunit 3 (subunit A)
MRKNILGAIVIFFVTVAFLLMIDDISNSKFPSQQHKVEVYEAGQQPDLATIDKEE